MTPASKTQSPGKSDEDKPQTKKPAAPRPDQMPPDVLEFITAVDEYKRVHQRPFPSWSEILEVLKRLGYEKAENER